MWGGKQAPDSAYCLWRNCVSEEGESLWRNPQLPHFTDRSPCKRKLHLIWGLASIGPVSSCIPLQLLCCRAAQQSAPCPAAMDSQTNPDDEFRIKQALAGNGDVSSPPLTGGAVPAPPNVLSLPHTQSGRRGIHAASVFHFWYIEYFRCQGIKEKHCSVYTRQRFAQSWGCWYSITQRVKTPLMLGVQKGWGKGTDGFHL